MDHLLDDSGLVRGLEDLEGDHLAEAERLGEEGFLANRLILLVVYPVGFLHILRASWWSQELLYWA